MEIANGWIKNYSHGMYISFPFSRETRLPGSCSRDLREEQLAVRRTRRTNPSSSSVGSTAPGTTAQFLIVPPGETVVPELWRERHLDIRRKRGSEMNAIEVIKTRRSVRSYKPDPIPRGNSRRHRRLRAIRADGTPACSRGEFVVVTDADTRRRIADDGGIRVVHSASPGHA